MKAVERANRRVAELQKDIPAPLQNSCYMPVPVFCISFFMKLFLFLIITVFLSSCFLFGNFRRSSFSYTGNGTSQTVPLVVPKGYNKIERQTDTSTGNEEIYYRYPGKAVLYFVVAKDTTKEYQQINYELNVPQPIYTGRFYKGIDSSHLYWRETRLGSYRAGYYNIGRGNDGEFDSAVNYFIKNVSPPALKKKS